ncbi:MAG: hypothetical protein ACJ8AQ_03810 [Gemmatimonadales bacterium]
MNGPFAFVVSGVGAGALVGLAIISGIVLGVDWLRSGSQTPQLNASFYLLVVGTLAGILAAAFSAWRLLAPVGSVYRRGALSIVCSFATVLLMLVCIPVHQLLGRIGLLGLILISGLIAALLAHRTRRLATGS